MKSKQRGGTFLGIILGAMIGLAAALIVAIYVAKVPLPFVNRNASRTSGQDAAEAEKNKGWDPNAPLRIRSQPAATPVSEPFAIPAPAEAARQPDSRPPAAPATATAVPRPQSSDPLGDLVAARTGGAQPPATGDPFTYFVQAGAFRTPDDAEAQRARLSLIGVQASVSEREQAGHQVYRVRVGPLQNRDAADRVKERLDGNGFEAALVRVQR